MHAASGRENGLDQAEIGFLIEKNADGIVVVDENGTVVFANPAAAQLFGRASELLIGSPIGIPLVAGETTDIVILRPDGDRVEAEVRVVETMWDDRSGRLASIRDVSLRRTMEERLRHSAKMEAIGRLTAGIAHDFNNHLTVVMGNLESAQRRIAAEGATVTRALDNAMRGAKRAAALTERLLAFARRKPLEPCVLDANQLVSGMSDLLQRTLGEEIIVRTSLSSDLWHVEADPGELEAAILNLAVNARDAMPSGGQLVIETTNVELDGAYPVGGDVIPGPHVLVSVADTGVGMTPEILKQAFEPFFTTKCDGHGTGLGLSQVYGFVKQSGGDVKLYSEHGLGTTAKIYLPRAPEMSTSTTGQGGGATEASEQIPISKCGETILVVEDDVDVRNYAVNSLRELGYAVTEAADAIAGLAIIQREPGFQLLLTDLGLPGGMDGRALAERAREIRPALKVLIMTAYAAGALVHDGRLDPGIELLSKPFTLASLASRLRELLNREEVATAAAPIVLVVEDEVLLRMFVVDLLTEAGYRVEEAGSFAQAQVKISEIANKLGAAIIDLGLPDRPGDELIAEIRAAGADIPIVLASGLGDAQVRERIAQDGRMRTLTKPFPAEALVGALQSLGAHVHGRS
jgi:signal transduction histidine kinase/DNA-binding response OmpR family regulator